MFAARADLSAGSYTIEHDFGVAEQVEFTMQIDVEELASTSYQVDFYTREAESDAWQLMGGVGCEAVDTNACFSFTRFRYVQAVLTATGSTAFESAVTGY